jgi:hypothetical protein
MKAGFVIADASVAARILSRKSFCINQLIRQLGLHFKGFIETRTVMQIQF